MKIKVHNGKYEFDASEWRLRVRRYGDDWIQDMPGTNAVISLMQELDAARVVVQAVRKLCAEGRAAAPLRGVLAHHDRLVASNEPPSEWATKEGE